MENKRELNLFLNACKSLGRIPTWAEYEHLRDVRIESPSKIELFDKHDRVFCDVTQFIKQTKTTGIQRVVESFRNLDVPDFQAVYFDGGHYYLLNQEKIYH